MAKRPAIAWVQFNDSMPPSRRHHGRNATKRTGWFENEVLKLDLTNVDTLFALCRLLLDRTQAIA